eukprot:3833487-Rhodomonas_salina.1
MHKKSLLRLLYRSGSPRMQGTRAGAAQLLHCGDRPLHFEAPKRLVGVVGTSIVGYSSRCSQATSKRAM